MPQCQSCMHCFIEKNQYCVSTHQFKTMLFIIKKFQVEDKRSLELELLQVRSLFLSKQTSYATMPIAQVTLFNWSKRFHNFYQANSSTDQETLSVGNFFSTLFVQRRCSNFSMMIHLHPWLRNKQQKVELTSCLEVPIQPSFHDQFLSL